MAGVMAKLDFEAILNTTHTRIRAYIAGMGVAPHEVDDVAQEVFIEFYRNMDRSPDDVEPERWLKGIARNVCLNHLRRVARRDRLHREALAQILLRTKTASDAALSRGALQVALEHCLDLLPAKSRQILRLRYEEDLPSRLIAKATNSTAEAIRVSLYRIREGLRDCIATSLALSEVRRP